MESLKVNLTNSSESRAQHRLPTGEVSRFANLVISRFSVGTRSYRLFLLRAFKHSVEAWVPAWTPPSVTSGGWQVGCIGDWRFCIVVSMQHQPTLQTVLSLSRVWIVGRTMTLWWLCLACWHSEEGKPWKYINMDKSAHSGCLLCTKRGVWGGRHTAFFEKLLLYKVELKHFWGLS